MRHGGSHEAERQLRQFDSTDGGRIRTFVAVGVEFDGTTDDAVTPTGMVTRSTFTSAETGVRILDGSLVTVSKNEFADVDIAVWVEGGINHALSRNNRVIANTMTDCFTCIFINDEADDPASFQLLDTLVASNVFRLTAPLTMQIAVDFRPLAPALTSVTGTVTGNTFIGFDLDNAIFNNHDWAGIDVRRNTIQPWTQQEAQDRCCAPAGSAREVLSWVTIFWPRGPSLGTRPSAPAHALDRVAGRCRWPRRRSFAGPFPDLCSGRLGPLGLARNLLQGRGPT